MAKGFGYQTQVGGPFAFTQVSDADCDAQYASAVATGALTNGLPVVSAIEWASATFNATFTAVTAGTGPTLWASFNPPAPHAQPFEIIRPITLANGANSDIAVNGASFLRIAGPTGAFSVSGFAAGYDGQELWIKSTVDQALTITNDATSATGNKILTATGADIVMAAKKCTAKFVYSVIDAHWLCVYPVATPA